MVSFAEFRTLRVLAENPETAEQRFYELAQWQFDRLMATSKVCVAAAAALIAALIASQLKSELHVSTVWIVLAVVFGIAVGSFGLLTYGRAGRHAELYARALDDLRKL